MTCAVESLDVLTGGQWVNVRGIMRWEPTPPPVPYAPLKIVLPPKPDTSTLVACPYCGARISETCKTPTGRSRHPHVGRLAPRFCACGASVERHKRYCEPCRIEARRLTYRLSKKRSAA